MNSRPVWMLISSLFILRVPCVGAQQAPAEIVARALATERAAKTVSAPIAFLSHERSSRTSGHLWLEKVVETQDGDLSRLLSIDGRPITPAMAKSEEERLARSVADPGSFRRANASGSRNQDLIAAVPKMFLFSYGGDSGGCTGVRFEPNPAFSPKTYEERVVHALRGVILIKRPDDRLCGIDAWVSQRVGFGYGLLGHVGPGGMIHMAAVPTPWGQWVTSELNVHVAGRCYCSRTSRRIRRTLAPTLFGFLLISR